MSKTLSFERKGFLYFKRLYIKCTTCLYYIPNFFNFLKKINCYLEKYNSNHRVDKMGVEPI